MAKLDLSQIRHDLIAGVVVFLIALPLSLGIALASGVPPAAGIMAALVGGLVVPIFSGARFSVSGPAAGLATVSLASLAQLGSFEAFLAAVILAGAIQIGLGFLRAGGIAGLVPAAVIQGMLAAIGISLIATQLPTLLGASTNSWHPLALGIGILAIALLAIYPRLKLPAALQTIPPQLAVVVLGGIAVLIAARAGAGLGGGFLLNLPGGSEFFTALPRPDFAVFIEPAVWSVALTLALIASLETLLNVEAIDRMDPAKHKTPSNRELKAQGVGNMVSGLLGGLPITSVIVRSSANLSAGAKSKLSIVIHGVLLLLAVLVLTPLLAWVPLAVLAAVVIMTGYKLASPAVVAQALKGGPESSLPFAAALILGVTSNLLVGVAAGTAISLVFLLVRQQRLGPEIEHRGNHLRIVLPEITSFLHRSRLEAALEQVQPGHSVELDLGKLHYCTQEIHHLIEGFLQDSARRGIPVQIKKSNRETNYELK